MENIKVFFSIVIIAPLIDYVWLFLSADGLYRKQIGQLMKVRPDIFPAALTYVLIAGFVTFFVLPKVTSSGGGVGSAFLWGALAGLILYGVFDLTNMSLLTGWTWTVSLGDMAWGTFLGGLLSVIAHALSKVF